MSNLLLLFVTTYTYTHLNKHVHTLKNNNIHNFEHAEKTTTINAS